MCRGIVIKKARRKIHDAHSFFVELEGSTVHLLNLSLTLGGENVDRRQKLFVESRSGSIFQKISFIHRADLASSATECYAWATSVRNVCQCDELLSAVEQVQL
jgi:hypothetical protein